MTAQQNFSLMADKNISEIPLFNQKSSITIGKRDKSETIFDGMKIQATLQRAARGLERIVSLDLVEKEFMKNLFNGITTHDIEKALIMAATSFVHKDVGYSYLGARLVLQKLYKEVFGTSVESSTLETTYRASFIRAIKSGVAADVFDKRLLTFDLTRLSNYMKIERDHEYKYMGMQVMYERYVKKIGTQRIEVPQVFWMRVAMGLAIDEEEKEKWAIAFYDLLSTLRFVSSTPTLFHAGTTHPQLSSCYLTTVSDDLHNIFKSVADNAQMSKWSGGVANDWTNVRATGAQINSIKVVSQGVVPFLKVANDVTAAINRSGSRRGATVVYLETWHYDIEDFLDLRRNTGDERRRTHDMNTANWIPDLFMKRVLEDGDWTLFSPEEVPELHHIYGREFEKKYEAYEQKARDGKIKLYKTVSALKMWRKMITRIFETGHPWMVFKDSCNVRSPQDHVGVVHSSNLCTEITLNTSEDETAVCNLGSVNLSKHIKNGKVDEALLEQTVQTGMRMLDNVIDINFYPTKEGQTSNMRHRPVGMGVMGFQDALFMQGIPFSDQQALDFADYMGEFVSYHAILGSSRLAKEHGTYPTYKGSKWDRDIFPIDTLSLLEQERGLKIKGDRSSKLDWTPVREHVKKYGMRNSNTMAIAPTATISNISGCFPCIEPIYKNVYVKANADGEFTVINEHLFNDLKTLGLWSDEMCEQIQYYDGSIQHIDSIPQELKDKYKTAFEIDPEWLIKITAARGKWIDQSQSHNIFMQGVSGKKLNDIYFAAWQYGLKSTYYLRTLGASQIEKSTLDAKKFGYTQKRDYGAVTTEQGAACAGLTPEECESCQ